MVDGTKQKLDGLNRYTMRFAPGQLPPVNAFWSLTMYEMPKSLLVANPINRYLLNSPMLTQFKRDADGVSQGQPRLDLGHAGGPAGGPFASVGGLDSSRTRVKPI
jgi:uncharacterized protein DUF1214